MYWRWSLKLFKGKDVLIETKHKTEESKRIRLHAMMAQCDRGEASRVEIIELMPPYSRKTYFAQYKQI